MTALRFFHRQFEGDYSVHGFQDRSTFQDWAAEQTDFPSGDRRTRIGPPGGLRDHPGLPADGLFREAAVAHVRTVGGICDHLDRHPSTDATDGGLTIGPPSSVVYPHSYVLRGEDHSGAAHFSDTRSGAYGGCASRLMRFLSTDTTRWSLLDNGRTGLVELVLQPKPRVQPVRPSIQASTPFH